MEHMKNIIWKKIIKAHLLSLVIILILYISFMVRSGSMTASLTVGLALIIAVFGFAYSEYRQYIRGFLE